MAMVQVRYIVTDVNAAIAFDREEAGFTGSEPPGLGLRDADARGFAAGAERAEPGRRAAGPMPDGRETGAGRLEQVCDPVTTSRLPSRPCARAGSPVPQRYRHRSWRKADSRRRPIGQSRRSLRADHPRGSPLSSETRRITENRECGHCWRVPASRSSGDKADISGPQGNQDQPRGNCPGRGVTPPAERARLPNRAFGTLHAPLPLPAYRGDRSAFAPHTAGLWPDCSMSAELWGSGGRADNARRFGSSHSEAEQLDGITAVYVDVVFGHLVTPLLRLATKGAGPDNRRAGFRMTLL